MHAHTFFIASAYGVTAIVIAGLILRAMIDHRIQRRSLAELEARGVGRRSRAKPAPGTSPHPAASEPRAQVTKPW